MKLKKNRSNIKSFARKMGGYLSPAWAKRKEQIANRVARKQTEARLRALKRKMKVHKLGTPHHDRFLAEFRNTEKKLRALEKQHRKLNKVKGRIKRRY